MFEAASALGRHADDRKRGISSIVDAGVDARLVGPGVLRKTMRTDKKAKKDKAKHKKQRKDKNSSKKKTKKKKKKKTTLKKDRWASSTDDDVESDDSSASTSSSEANPSTAVAAAIASGLSASVPSPALGAPTSHQTASGISATNTAAAASAAAAAPLSAIDQRRAQSLALRQTSVWEGCRSVNNYEKLNHIQEGTYGVVFRAKCLQTGDTVALKQVKFNKMVANRMGFPSTALREINVLLRMNHPNIIQVREMVVGSDTDKIFMVMEYMEHDLKMLMEAMGNIYFHQSEVKCLMAQLLSAINYMHGLWFLHRDLKTSNLLYGSDGNLRVCDYGLARQYGDPVHPYTKEIITQWYRPPELLLGATIYSAEVDMWSVGCIFAELLTKKPLFVTKVQSELAQLKTIFEVHGTPTKERWPGFSELPNATKFRWKTRPRSTLRSIIPASSFTGGPYLTAAGFELLNGLLSYDPKTRTSAADAVKHEYFSEAPLAKAAKDMPHFPATTAGVRKPKMQSPQHVFGGFQ